MRSQATIPNIHGYVLLPDEWELPEGMSFVPRANDWKTNTYTISQWRVMEQAGAVFLPATGERGGTSGRICGKIDGNSTFRQKEWHTLVYVIYFL